MSDGRRIKSSMLLRTAELSEVSEDDMHSLCRDYHVNLVIDLRGNSEISSAPDPVMEGVQWVNAPIVDFALIQEMARIVQSDEEFKFRGNDPLSQIRAAEKLIKVGFYPNLYRAYIESEFGRNGLEKFFREIISNEDGAVLWHCKEGKDRTGIAAALLLAALGANYETILADYELSNLFYRREASQLEKLFHAMGYPQEYLDMTVAVFAGVHFSFLEQAWRYIETEWGTPVGFIQNALGISSTDIELLKGRYLEK